MQHFLLVNNNSGKSLVVLNVLQMATQHGCCGEVQRALLQGQTVHVPSVVMLWAAYRSRYACHVWLCCVIFTVCLLGDNPLIWVLMLHCVKLQF